MFGFLQDLFGDKKDEKAGTGTSTASASPSFRQARGNAATQANLSGAGDQDEEEEEQGFWSGLWDSVSSGASALAGGAAELASDAAELASDTVGRLTDDGPSAEEELSATPEERAKLVHRAVRGLGTDEDMLIRALSGTKQENAQVAAAYKRLYGEDLGEVLESELSGADLAIARDLVGSGKVSLTSRIKRALEGWGADGDRIIALFEAASKEERAAVLGDKALMARIADEAGDEVAARLRQGPVEEGEKDEEAAATLLAQVKQRGAGWGTDEEGMFSDLEAFAKKYPEVAKRIAKNPEDPVHAVLSDELGGRDYDKAIGILKGGGTRSALSLLEDEANRWGTDEDAIMATLRGMSADERKRYAEGTEDRARLVELLRSELGDSDYAEAMALLDDGTEDNVDKIRVEVEGWVVNDRTVLDAVVAMSADERKRFREDAELRAAVRAGVSEETWAKIASIAGFGAKAGKRDEGAAQVERLATIILDGADHLLDDDEDQVYAAVLEAQRLAAEGKLDMKALRKRIEASGALDRDDWPKVWQALEGTRALTSIDRLDQAVEGLGTDDTALTEMIDDLSGRDLLENWSNIAEYRARVKALERARSGGDPREIQAAARAVQSFILDVNPGVLEKIRGDTSGDERVDVLGKLRDRIKAAAQNDAEFKAGLSAAGLALDEVDLEKIDYVQSAEAMDVHRHEGQWYSGNLLDPVSSKGRQLDDAHADYMGTLRSGIAAQERGEMTAADVVKSADAKEDQFEDRLTAYKSMKSAVANVAATVAATIAAVVTTILTGGAAAGFWGGLIFGGELGAAMGLASALTKEVVQGGSYSMVEEGLAEAALTTLSTALFVGTANAFASISAWGKFEESLGKALESRLSFLGKKAASGIAKGVQASTKMGVGDLVRVPTNALASEAVGNEEFFRQGWEGALERIGTDLAANVPKDMVMMGLTEATLAFAGIDPTLMEGTVGKHTMRGALGGFAGGMVRFGAATSAWDWVANAGHLSDEEILNNLLTAGKIAAIGAATNYIRATDMLHALNKWTAEELQRFDGIGPKLARNIVAYRQQNGAFTQLQDIKNVAYIGDVRASNIYERKGDHGTVVRGRSVKR